LLFCAATAIASPAQLLTTLASFDGTNGANPQNVTLIQGTDGDFYGTTYYGGSSNNGTVFKITTGGTLTTLYSFCSQTNCSDGYWPSAGLIQAKDGNFYGTTVTGGNARYGGTIFKITPEGTLTTLYSFCAQTSCVDGQGPEAVLLQGSDGNFYGTTAGGGNANNGTIFKITPSGTLTTLYSFCATNASCPDGGYPTAGLIQASDGNFYGTTESGGLSSYACFARYGCGTVFKITPSGTLTTLYTFCSQPNCGDGLNPIAGLVQAADGNLYGTTFGIEESPGPPNPCGTVFSTTLSGTLKTLWNFNNSGGYGCFLEAGLLPTSNEHFYGSTGGTIFEVTSAGQITLLYEFGKAGIDNDSDAGGLVQGTDGKLYGTTAFGGSSNNCLNGQTCGTVFSLTLESLASFSPTNVAFSPQILATTSAPSTVQVTNTGALPLTLSNISISGANAGDFGQSNTCPPSLANAESCQIKVTFTPTAGGNRSAALVVTDNAPGSPQSVALTGTLEDFSVTASSSSTQTVTPGQVANYSVTVSPLSGFNQTVSFSCSGAPAQSTCSVSPASVKLDGSNPAPVAVAVTTAGNSARLAHPAGFQSIGARAALWFALFGVSGLVLLGGSGSRSRRQRSLFNVLACLCLFSLAVTFSACGGGGAGTGSGVTGTPAGSYNLTVTGTFTAGSANLAHTAKLTLVVQ